MSNETIYIAPFIIPLLFLIKYFSARLYTEKLSNGWPIIPFSNYIKKRS